MKEADALTLLLPLKGRDNCTRYLLDVLEEVEFPFKIVIADGSGKDNKKIVQRKSLRIEYRNHGVDSSINQYMKKMRDAIETIDSPLTMMIDNDDLLSVQGLSVGIKFLEKNKDYISYRGTISEGLGYKPIYSSTDIVGENPLERVKQATEIRNAPWHDTIRTDVLKKFFNVCYESGSNDLQMVFTLNVMWQASFGKVKRTNSQVYYYHCGQKSLVQNKNIYHKYNQWMKRGSFNDSINIIASSIAAIIGMEKKEEIAEFVGKDVAKKNKRNYKSIPLSDSYDLLFKEIIGDGLIKNDFNITSFLPEYPI